MRSLVFMLLVLLSSATVGSSFLAPRRCVSSRPVVAKDPNLVSSVVRIRGGSDEADAVVKSASAIVQVMKVHRFVALAFGLWMVLAPGGTDFGLSQKKMDRSVSFTVQSWGIFVLFVAYVVQSSLGFSAEAQLTIAKGLSALFALEVLLYAYEAALGDKEGRPVAMSYLVIFGALAAAYGVAVLKES